MNQDLVTGFVTVLTPFVMMSSCATLVWGLQGRYSRVVQSIRSLASERRLSADEVEQRAIERQINLLRKRARWLRNGVVGHYLAMGCFLFTSILLVAALSVDWALGSAAVGCFFAGLILVCWTVANSFYDTVRSFGAVGEELRNRVLARIIHTGHATTDCPEEKGY